VNHYGGSEGFFGWLALQTVQHRCNLGDLRESEAKALGPNLRRLENGIYDFWKTLGCQVDRVYVMYFLEGQLERKSGHEWHLHIHLVPRFHLVKPLMVKPNKREVDAYRIATLGRKLPSRLNRKTFGRQYGQQRLVERELGIVRGVVSASRFPKGRDA
jgi:diadenosine tetraphosphate (Ap4A) HIT family hydrolase